MPYAPTVGRRTSLSDLRFLYGESVSKLARYGKTPHAERKIISRTIGNLQGMLASDEAHVLLDRSRGDQRRVDLLIKEGVVRGVCGNSADFENNLRYALENPPRNSVVSIPRYLAPFSLESVKGIYNKVLKSDTAFVMETGLQ